jgi:hypothetical protein
LIENTNPKEHIVKETKIRGFISTGVIAGLLIIAGCAQEQPSAPDEEFAIDRTTVNGLPSITGTASGTSQVTVESIDYDNRSIALKGPDGKSEIFSVPPEVKNFNQIQKGDVVKAQYMQTIDVNVRKVGQPLSVAEVASVATAAPGDKPGIVAVRTVQTLANVQDIDYKARTVTLIGVSNKPVTFTVNKAVTSFDNVAKGDQVVFTYTEAVSIDVSK